MTRDLLVDLHGLGAGYRYVGSRVFRYLKYGGLLTQ